VPSEAAEILAKALEVDALAHEAGQFANIGMRYDPVLGEILPINDIPEQLFGLAFGFWDCWLDAANHDWLHHEPMSKADWPNVARVISQCLRAGALPTDPMILNQFLPKPPSPSLLQRLKQWFVRHT